MYTQTYYVATRTPRLLAAVLLSILLGLAALAAPVRAQALGVNLAQCTGTHNAQWSPGVTNTPQLITVNTQSQWTCVQLQLPLLINASSTNQFTAQFACESLLAPAPATWTINWGDGATSTFAFTASVNAVNGNLVITAPGRITAGRYANASATATFILQDLADTLKNLCATTGVTNASGVSTLTITQVAL
jgi:hypothetical protein